MNQNKHQTRAIRLISMLDERFNGIRMVSFLLMAQFLPSPPQINQTTCEFCSNETKRMKITHWLQNAWVLVAIRTLPLGVVLCELDRQWMPSNKHEIHVLQQTTTSALSMRQKKAKCNNRRQCKDMETAFFAMNRFIGHYSFLSIQKLLRWPWYSLCRDIVCWSMSVRFFLIFGVGAGAAYFKNNAVT